MSKSLRSYPETMRTGVAQRRVAQKDMGLGTLAAFGFLKQTPPRMREGKRERDDRQRPEVTADHVITIMPWGVRVAGKSGAWDEVECGKALKATSRSRMAERYVEMALLSKKSRPAQCERKLAEYLAFDTLHREAVKALAS